VLNKDLYKGQSKKYLLSTAAYLVIGWIFLSIILTLVSQVTLQLSSRAGCHGLNSDICNLELTYQLHGYDNSVVDNLWVSKNDQRLIIDNIKILNAFNREVANIPLNNKTTTVQELLNVGKTPFVVVTNSQSKQLQPKPILRVLLISLVAAFIMMLVSPIILIIVIARHKMRNLFILPSPNLNNKLLCLNFFRFLAASIVVFFHFGGDAIRDSIAKIFTSGPQMVTFFFVLSGFVMIIAHYDKQDETARDYYKLRFARLYPVYFIALLLQIRSNSSFLDILLNTLLFQAFIPGRSLAINQPGWSLSAEAFFYLCFPLLLILYRKRNFLLNVSIMSTFVLLSIVVAFYGETIFGGNNRVQFLNYFPLIHFVSFIAGNMIGIIYLNCRELRFRSSALNSLLVGISFILMLLDLSSGGFVKYFTSIVPEVVVNVPFFSIFIFCMVICGNSIFHEILQNKICLRLGDLSYSIYILQFFVFNKLANVMLLISSQWLQFIIPYVLLLGLSYVAYKYIEVPCKKLILKI
jgi:peptidoglycan/LPS O-acetylase OafA/YrhL